MSNTRIKIEHERTADYTGYPTGEYCTGYVGLNALADLITGESVQCGNCHRWVDGVTA